MGGGGGVSALSGCWLSAPLLTMVHTAGLHILAQTKARLDRGVWHSMLHLGADCILELTHDASYQQRAGADMVTLDVCALCRHRCLHEAWSAHCGGGPQ